MNPLEQTLEIRNRLFAEGPPENKNLFAGGPPANKKLFAVGTPENKKLFDGGSPENKTFGSDHLLRNQFLQNSVRPPPYMIKIIMALTPPPKIIS